MHLECVDMRHGCPDCGGDQFHAGQYGGHAIDVKCGACGACFGYCAPRIWQRRLDRAAGIYSDDSMTLRELALLELVRLSEEMGAYNEDYLRTNPCMKSR